MLISKSLYQVWRDGTNKRQWGAGKLSKLVEREAAASVQVSRLRRQRVTRLFTERLKWRAGGIQKLELVPWRRDRSETKALHIHKSVPSN